MTMKFNGQQREGLARLLDTYAAAASIAFGTYLVGRLDISYWEAVVLIIIAMTAVGGSLIFRRENENV